MNKILPNITLFLLITITSFLPWITTGSGEIDDVITGFSNTKITLYFLQSSPLFLYLLAIISLVMQVLYIFVIGRTNNYLSYFSLTFTILSFTVLNSVTDNLDYESHISLYLSFVFYSVFYCVLLAINKIDKAE